MLRMLICEYIERSMYGSLAEMRNELLHLAKAPLYEPQQSSLLTRKAIRNVTA